MNIKIWEKIALSCILLFSLFVYTYKLDTIPSAIYSDEATVGYNAYSILKTGKDEYGKHFPLAFRFFGAYTPPLYVYLTIPLVKFFGLNPISLRLLSVLFTLFGIVTIFSFAKVLFKKEGVALPVFSVLIFALSPWAIFNARLGYEVTAGYVTYVIGLFLIWSGFSRNKISLSGLLILSLSTYFAHTERFLVPIFLVSFVATFYSEIRAHFKIKDFFGAGLVLFISQIPNLFIISTNAFWVKNSVYSNSSLQKIIQDFIFQYLSYLSPSKIFGLSEDINLQHTIPELASFFPLLLPFFIIGLWKLYKQREKKETKFLLLLLLTSPIPGALSGHFISIQRVLPLIFPITIITAIGVSAVYKKTKPIIFIPASISFLLFSLLMVWRSYFILLPQERAVWWNYGFQQLAVYTQKNYHKSFVLDNSRDQSLYMQVLYHTKFNPETFQSSFNSEFVNNYYKNPVFNPNHQVGNVAIRPIVWEKDIFIDQVIVGDPLAVSKDQAKEHFLDKVLEIKDPLGNVVLIGYQTSPNKKIEANLKKLYSQPNLGI